MNVEEKRKVGGEIKPNRLTSSSRPSERKENNSNNRGGGRLVKSGLISPNRRGSNHPRSTKGRVERTGWEMGRNGGAGLEDGVTGGDMGVKPQQGPGAT